jgi:hypothetical protein
MAEPANIVRWVLALGGKFLRIVPGTTAVAVTATLASQLAMLAASLLPLKVLMLLGSSGIPAYFPEFLAGFDRNVLVVTLSIAAGICYLLHLLAEQGVRIGADRGAQRLLAHERKMILFDDQDEFAARSYRRYAYALACSVFVLLAFALLTVVYPGFALLVAVYIPFAALVLAIGRRCSPRLAERLRSGRKPVFAVAAGIGFLCGFVWLVVDFMGGSPPGLLSALIGLLLLRQLFSRASDAAVEIGNLYGQRVNLNALFFHRQVLLRAADEVEGIWSLFEPARRGEWAGSVLNELADVSPTASISTRWQQTGIRNVLALEAGISGDDRSAWLLRLFDQNCNALAVHEATLLGAMPAGSLPAPVFLGATRVGDFHCHGFLCSGLRRVPPAEVGAVASSVTKQLLEVEPPPDLAARYERSHPYLWQRIDRRACARLFLPAERPEQREAVTALDSSWDELCAILRALPLVFINPELNAETLRYDGEGMPSAVYWGRWSLDPLGAAWPVHDKGLADLAASLETAIESGHRSALKSVSAAQARLAARVYALEQLLTRQQYAQAVDLIPLLLADVAQAREERTAGIARRA